MFSNFKLYMPWKRHHNFVFAKGTDPTGTLAELELAYPQPKRLTLNEVYRNMVHVPSFAGKTWKNQKLWSDSSSGTTTSMEQELSWQRA